MEIKQEQWKDIKGWEEYYQVSNLGRVKSKDRATRNGQGKYVKKGQVLKGGEDSSGYLQVNLRNQGRSKMMLVHRLVAIHFIKNPKGKPCVNHLDFNPHNNNAGNLEWCTHQENTDYSIRSGRYERTKEWNYNLKTSNKYRRKPVIAKNIKTSKELYFVSMCSTREKGFDPSCVWRCCNGKGKTHKGYTWRYDIG